MSELDKLHENVPADYYDRGIQHNFFQRIWHQKRFEQLRQFTDKPSGTILDIGCHSGLFTHEILKRNKLVSVYGIDISQQAISYAKKRIPGGHFFQGDAAKLPFKDNFFDSIFCLEMLEHVEHPERVVLEMKRVLKKKGTGIILIPTDNPLFTLIWFLWNTFTGVWRHTHIQNFNDQKLTKLLTDSGLTVVKRKKTHGHMLLLVAFTK